MADFHHGVCKSSLEVGRHLSKLVGVFIDRIELVEETYVANMRSS